MEAAGGAGQGGVDAEILLNGMLDKERLLDIVENFILFDASKSGSVRKVVARNHQVLGVNSAVASVIHQEELKQRIPASERLTYRLIELPSEQVTDADQQSLLPADEPKMLHRLRSVLER